MESITYCLIWLGEKAAKTNTSRVYATMANYHGPLNFGPICVIEGDLDNVVTIMLCKQLDNRCHNGFTHLVSWAV